MCGRVLSVLPSKKVTMDMDVGYRLRWGRLWVVQVCLIALEEAFDISISKAELEGVDTVKSAFRTRLFEQRSI